MLALSRFEITHKKNEMLSALFYADNLKYIRVAIVKIKCPFMVKILNKMRKKPKIIYFYGTDIFIIFLSKWNHEIEKSFIIIRYCIKTVNNT